MHGDRLRNTHTCTYARTHARYSQWPGRDAAGAGWLFQADVSAAAIAKHGVFKVVFAGRLQSDRLPPLIQSLDCQSWWWWWWCWWWWRPGAPKVVLAHAHTHARTHALHCCRMQARTSHSTDSSPAAAPFFLFFFFLFFCLSFCASSPSPPSPPPPPPPPLPLPLS